MKEETPPTGLLSPAADTWRRKQRPRFIKPNRTGSGPEREEKRQPAAKQRNSFSPPRTDHDAREDAAAARTTRGNGRQPARSAFLKNELSRSPGQSTRATRSCASGYLTQAANKGDSQPGLVASAPGQRPERRLEALMGRHMGNYIQGKSKVTAGGAKVYRRPDVFAMARLMIRGAN